MDGSRRLPLFVGLLCAVALTAPGVLAVPGYSLSATPSLDVPDQTITYEDKQFTIESITRVFDGESVSVTADVPADATYEINFRGPENQLISSNRYTGDTTHTLDYFGSGEAGTYAVTIRDENERKAVYPVVLAGYDIDVDAPSSAVTGESVTVDATLREQDIETHSSIDRVELVVADDDVAVRQQMERDSEGQYTATVSTADIDPATYNLYVVVRGDEDVRQRAEVLAMSDLSSLTISERSTETDTVTDTDSDQLTETSTPTETDSDQSTVGDGNETMASPNSETATVTPTETRSTPTATPGTTTQPDQTTAVTSTASTTATSATPTTESETNSPTMTPSQSPIATDQTDRASETARTTTDETGNGDVIEPATPSSETVTSESGPGFTIMISLFAILTLLYFRFK